jgi:thioredoxin 1
MNKIEFQHIVLEAEKPVVVDFWAPWCSPCRVTKPILERTAADFTGLVDFLAVNADESRELLEEYRILGIPAVLAFHHGKAVARLSGAQPESGYRGLFEALAEGREIKNEIAPMERVTRLGAGVLLALFGYSSNNWWVIGLGLIIAFMGIHDRCPVWKAITARFQRQ